MMSNHFKFEEFFPARHARLVASTVTASTPDSVGLVPSAHQNDVSSASQVRHLTQLDLSRRWRMSMRTLEAWRYQKIGCPFLKLNGRVVYRLEDVEAFERAQRRGSL